MKTKLTLNDAPAAQAAAKPAPQASSDVVVRDSLGRDLTLREPGILDESRLARLMGDSSTNMGYMLGYVTPAAMVVAIDGVEMPFPRSEPQVDAAIQRLGREGLAAVMGHLTAQAQDAQARAEAVKK
jgi:hypothetical protein